MVIKVEWGDGLRDKEIIVAGSGNFATCIGINTANSKNVITVDDPASDIFHTAVAVQEVLPLPPMIGTHALFELLIKVELNKFIHPLRNSFLTTDSLEDRIEIACDNLLSTQERLGVFVTKKRKTIAYVFM